MSWTKWNKSLNSIVSHGIEQVNKLKDDVEKKFDEAVTEQGENQVAAEVSEAKNILAEPTVFAGQMETEDEEGKSPVGHDLDVEDGWDDIPEDMMLDENEVETHTGDDVLEESKLSTKDNEPMNEQTDPVEESVDYDVKQAAGEAPVMIEVSSVGEDQEYVGAKGTAVDASNAGNSTHLTDGVSMVEAMDITPADPLPVETIDIADAYTETVETPVGVVADVNMQTNPHVKTAGCESLESELQEKHIQLEKASSTMLQMHEELENITKRECKTRADLEKALSEIEMLKQSREKSSTSNSAVHEANREIKRLKSDLKEKESIMEQLMEEGEALSKKQGTFEARIRQLRREKDELVSSKADLEAKFERIKKSNDQNKENADLLEAEKKQLKKKLKALDTSHSDSLRGYDKQSNELIKIQAQLEEAQSCIKKITEENQALRVSLEESKAQNIKHLASNYDQGILQSTVEQLEGALTRAEQEANHREENLQAQLQDMKRRWKGATARIDEMGASVSEATQPLIRQISALQSDQRARSEAWRATEKSLLDRLNQSDNDAKEMEKTKHEVEMQILEKNVSIESYEKQLRLLKSKLSKEETEVKKLKVTIASQQNTIDELKIAIDQSQQQSEFIQKEMEALKASHSQELARMESRSSMSVSQLDGAKQKQDELLETIENLKDELKRQELKFQDAIKSQQAQVPEAAPQIVKQELKSSNPTILELNHMRQGLSRREREVVALKQQLRSMEASKATLAEELIQLTNKHSTVQTQIDELTQKNDQLQVYQTQYEVLLELLGEKEEELDEVLCELEQYKNGE